MCPHPRDLGSHQLARPVRLDRHQRPAPRPEAPAAIAGLALIAEHYSGRRIEMMGYALMGSTGGAVLGPLLGGWLYRGGGYALPLLVLLVPIAVEAMPRQSPPASANPLAC